MSNRLAKEHLTDPFNWTEASFSCARSSSAFANVTNFGLGIDSGFINLKSTVLKDLRIFFRYCITKFVCCIS